MKHEQTRTTHNKSTTQNIKTYNSNNNHKRKPIILNKHRIHTTIPQTYANDIIKNKQRHIHVCLMFLCCCIIIIIIYFNISKHIQNTTHNNKQTKTKHTAKHYQHQFKRKHITITYIDIRTINHKQNKTKQTQARYNINAIKT